MKALQLEFFKTHKKHFGLIIALIEGVQILWVFWSYRHLDARDLSQGYLGLFYQFPLINCIVFPVLASIIVSRNCDLEHKGNMFKELFTLQKPGSIFDAKLIFTGIYLAGITLFQLLFIMLFGRVKGFQDTLCISDFISFFISQFFVSLFLALLIQILALRFVNQFIPVVAGLIASFLGLMSMFFPDWLMRLVPSSYYGLLSTVHMDWNQAARLVTYFHVPFSITDFSILFILLILLYILGKIRFVDREV